MTPAPDDLIRQFMAGFYGYGNPQVRWWFIGQEEGGAAGPCAVCALVFQWIAFNALYGRWNVDRRESIAEHDAIDQFVDQVLAIDESGHIRSVLDEHKKLAMALFDNSYLNRYFWKDPSKERARKTEKAKFNAQGWYVQGDYTLILSGLLERIHFLRCQLVHGASTHNGKLNRTAVQHCATMLALLLPAFLLVLIDHGYAEDWGPLCYPPVTD